MIDTRMSMSPSLSSRRTRRRGSTARGEWSADLVRDLAEALVPDVSQEAVALTKRARAGPPDVGIHVTVGDEEVEQAVVVHVDEPDAPSEVRPHRGDQTGPDGWNPRTRRHPG